MKNFACSSIRLLSIFFGACLFLSCGTPKDTAMSRSLQNLTARYNYRYNANLILDNYARQGYENYRDDFSELLPVFTDPEKFNYRTLQTTVPNERELDKVIAKAQAIIADKSFSNYIDEAYLILGKANFYKANYFIAQEFFDYTAKTYPADPETEISALNWKARSMMQLDNRHDAALLLDTVYSLLPEIKHHRAEPLATIAQMYIDQQRYQEAIPLLEEAARSTELNRNRIRWTYLLAQLYEKEKNYQEALVKYLKVQHSNGNFELYFNANLNRIRLTGVLNGEKTAGRRQLLALLKDDKNFDYTDQIYFHVAENHAENKEFADAVHYYNLSLRKNRQNSYQKGLAYLRLADLNFRQYKDFLRAKLYYDSTVATLPKTYPGYEQILKKSNNLDYISKRYELIAFEDTVQSLVSLPEKDRLQKVKAIIFVRTKVMNSAIPNNRPNETPGFPTGNAGGSTFYFRNSTALSNGYTDFITRWGNRQLEDNWRQSQQSAAQQTHETVARVLDAGQPDSGTAPRRSGSADQEITRYLDAVPLTPEQLNHSNQKIIDAYTEMANFYQQELDDPQEATRIYKIILERYPENNRLALIYYSLYLNAQKADPVQAAQYKKLVLEKFPQSGYAKTILDPQYGAKQSELETRIFSRYNEIFDQYLHKDFAEVIAAVNLAIRQYPGGLMNPQMSYLRAIAIGRTAPIDSLLPAFQGIVAAYKDDQLIVPLVKDHLAYIQTHMAEFRRRKVALPDFDPAEPRFFTAQPLPERVTAPATLAEKPLEKIVSVKDTVIRAGRPASTGTTAVPNDQVFSTAESAVYYYVIDVADASLTLSSSRFGIGQFNRGNYPGSKIRHQLTEFDNDQLIYVGNFSSFAAVKSYADGITPQLKQIMKVPEGLYSSFIISKENFEKLTSKALVNRYLEFYKNNDRK